MSLLNYTKLNLLPSPAEKEPVVHVLNSEETQDRTGLRNHHEK